MLYFFADNHFGKRPGLQLYERLFRSMPCAFHEDDWAPMAVEGFGERCSLLVLNLIGDTCGIPHPDAAAEAQVKTYAERGGSFLLLHGASAAFWKWDWWRTLVGLRWVRLHDPDGVEPSTHPVRPFVVKVSKCRHRLCKSLQTMSLPEDEIYIHLEQTSPVTVLMQTHTDEGIFPQCWEAYTPWGGRVIGFLPGHNPEAFDTPGLVDNVRLLLDDLPRLDGISCR